MTGESRQGLSALGTTMAGLGGGILVALAIGQGRTLPNWLLALAWSGLVIGLLILVAQAFPALGRWLGFPFRALRLRRQATLVRDARYRQRIRCSSCGHEWEEVVRSTRQGWLEHDGAIRTCPNPDCGNTTLGFSSVGAIPLNKAAKKLKAM